MNLALAKVFQKYCRAVCYKKNYLYRQAYNFTQASTKIKVPFFRDSVSALQTNNDEHLPKDPVRPALDISTTEAAARPLLQLHRLDPPKAAHR